MRFCTLVYAFLPALSLAQVFPVPKGNYKVQWTSKELLDKSRVDPFNATHQRRMMISQFSPVATKDCVKTCKVPYMSPEIAKIEDAILDAFLQDVGGWPEGQLAGLEVEACCKVKKGGQQDDKPTILFDTGLNTTRLFYTGVAQHVAALGYHVIVMDHPYETDIVQFPDGEIIYGGQIGRNPNNTAELQLGLDVRADDTNFILNEFDIRRTVFIGQSFGGAAAATAMAKETRIAGGVNLDGAFWGHEINEGVRRPFLAFGSEGHNSSSPDETSWGRFFDSMDKRHSGTWYKELNLAGSVHGSYYDMSLLGDVLDLRGSERLKSVFGSITGKRTMEVLQAYLGAFIAFAYYGAGEGVLAGERDEFGEVAFLRTWLD